MPVSCCRRGMFRIGGLAGFLTLLRLPGGPGPGLHTTEWNLWSYQEGNPGRPQAKLIPGYDHAGVMSGRPQAAYPEIVKLRLGAAPDAGRTRRGARRAGRGRVAMAFTTGAPGRIRHALRGDARAMRRQPGRRRRDTGTAGACRAGGGAAAAGRPLSDVGMADRVAGAAAGAPGTCPLVGRLAVGPRADLRPAGSVRPRRDPPAAARTVVDVGADPHPVVAVARRPQSGPGGAAARAVLEERPRIARELHDVVAHHMSLIAVRAETASYRLPGLPESAQAEFGSLSEEAREGLAEMRRLLAVLRDDQPAALAPQPQLADLPVLVDTARKAGLSVELSVPVSLHQVPSGIGLCAYRIVQESLANASQHAPGAAVTVSVDT